MTQLSLDISAAYATGLLVHYCFELGKYKAEELVNAWSDRYPATWVRFAVIEALYLGRYKAVSVEQILATWQRRGRPLYHFNHDFELLIGRKIPVSMTGESDFPIIEESNVVSLPSAQSTAPTVVDTGSAAFMESTQRHRDFSTTTAVSVKEFKTSAEFDEVANDAADRHLEPVLTIEVKQEEALNASRHTNQTECTRWESGSRPIEQFTPTQTAEVSDFYIKLKAIAHHDEDLIADGSSIFTEHPSEPEGN